MEIRFVWKCLVGRGLWGWSMARSWRAQYSMLLVQAISRKLLNWKEKNLVNGILGLATFWGRICF